MTDLTKCVDAAARALYTQQWPGKVYDALTPLVQHQYRECVTPVVAAVAPLIEREAKAAALEEAAALVLRSDWLRDRARLIREGQ